MNAETSIQGESLGKPSLALRIIDLRPVAEQVKEITVASADGGPLPGWEPGAHISVQISPEIERQYSLCGPLESTDLWRIAVLHAPQSRGGSAAIHKNWKIGNVVEASGPRNHFPLENAEHYLFIAGGIGITPLLPMIEQVRKTGRDWRLVYCGRSRASMAYLDSVAELSGNTLILPEDEVGRPDLRALTEDLQARSLVYSCGPEGLLNALVDLTEYWPRNQLRLERFSPVTSRESSSDLPFVAHLRASGLSIQVKAEESLLDAMTREGITRSAACREGTCGTCETRVLSGAILHRDCVLSEEERAAGEWMMACVSRARDAEIEIDA